MFKNVAGTLARHGLNLLASAIPGGQFVSSVIADILGCEDKEDALEIALANATPEQIIELKKFQDKNRVSLQKLVLANEAARAEQAAKAIRLEARSKDPYVNRVRPTFLYVMYAVLLAAIPIGIISAFDPSIAGNIAAGAKGWFGAVPESVWTLFGVGYLGYTGARSYDKRRA